MSSQYKASGRSGVKAWYPLDINAFFSAFQKNMEDRNAKAVSETAIGSAIINTLVHFVIGQGLEVQSAPENFVLNWSDEQLSKFMSQSESLFRMYAGSTRIDHYGRCSFNQLQSVAFRNILESGDALLHRSYRNGHHDYEPYIQVLSGKWVRNPNGEYDNKKVIGGVEFDSVGREKAYYIAQTLDDLTDSFQAKRFEKYNPKSNFEEYKLIRLDLREANQVRGIPVLMPVLEDIFDLETFKSAYRTKAAVQALLTAVITSEKDAPAPVQSTLENLKNLGVRNDDAPIQTNTDDAVDVSLGSGNILALNPGEKMDTVESKVPAADYEKYNETELSHIAAGVGGGGIAYEMLLQKYNNNYSASRATIAGQEKKFRDLRDPFALAFCNPVWEQVIDWGIRRGIIEAPGYLEGDWRYKQAVLSCTWIGPSPININPKDEIEAHIIAIDNGLETKEDVVRELFGKDYEETVQRRRKEMAMDGMGNFDQNAETAVEETNDEESK